MLVKQEFPRRRLILGLSATSVSVALCPPAFAEDCAKSRVDELRERCLQILNDIEATIQTGRSLEGAAWSKAQDAIEPSYECAKGGYDLSLALFKDCNPSSPGVNPLTCIETLAGVPDTVESCRSAISLVQEAWSLYEQASFIYGTADIAFSDQGGDEIADELAKCGESGCLELGRAVTQYARGNKSRTEQNKNGLQMHENELNQILTSLNKCEDDKSSCAELPQFQFPILEPIDNGPPDITLN